MVPPPLPTSGAQDAGPYTAKRRHSGAAGLWSSRSTNAAGLSLLQNNKLPEFALTFAMHLKDPLPVSPLSLESLCSTAWPVKQKWLLKLATGIHGHQSICPFRGPVLCCSTSKKLSKSSQSLPIPFPFSILDQRFALSFAVGVCSFFCCHTTVVTTSHLTSAFGTPIIGQY